MAIKHQQIVDAVEDALQLITIANGYNLNLSTHITVQQAEGDQINNGDWLVTIRDRDEESLTESTRRDNTGNQEFRRMYVDVELQYMQSTTNVSVQIRKAIADIRKALGVDRTLGGLSLNVLPAGWSIPRNELGQYLSGQAIVRFTIDYKTAIFQS